MTRKALGAIITSVISLVVACAAGGVLLLGGGAASGCTMPLPSGTASVSTPAGGWQPVGRFDPEQVGHAATIAAVGAQRASRSAAGSSPRPPRSKSPTCETSPAVRTIRSGCSNNGPAKAGAPSINYKIPHMPPASSTKGS